MTMEHDDIIISPVISINANKYRVVWIFCALESVIKQFRKTRMEIRYSPGMLHF
jgi:hypothetical protein